MIRRWTITGALASGLCLLVVMAAVMSAEPAPMNRDQLRKQYENGNYKVAYDGLRKLVLAPQADPKEAAADLELSAYALASLGRSDEIDAFVEEAVKVHAKQWRVLAQAAAVYQNTEHYGFRVAGVVHRGNRRGGGEYVTFFERDRVRSLQLMLQAVPLIENEPNRRDKSDFFLRFGSAVAYARMGGSSWKLQILTDLNELPDYVNGWQHERQSPGAPVDAKGEPVFYGIAKSWDAAANDGERWRWCLLQALEFSPERTNEIRYTYASFLQNQFGVQTMGQYFAPPVEEDEVEKDAEAGPYSVHTLKDDETICRLATGIRRMKLPDDQNFILIYQQIADQPQTGYGDHALSSLAGVYENRRQFPQAAKVLERLIKQYGKGPGDSYQMRLDQIRNNWGRVEGSVSQAVGQGATIGYRFRNGHGVSFEAYQIKFADLLTDMKTYLQQKPKQVQWEKVDINNIGYRLVQQNETKYIGAKVAEWNLELEPKPDHVDRRVSVTTPLQKGGAYLLVAKMKDGNVSRTIIWLNDLIIVRKPLKNEFLYYVADAVTGTPVAQANVEFFGWRQFYDKNTPRTEFANFAENTDASGSVFVTQKLMSNNFQWVAIARKDGKLAHLGFSNVWYRGYHPGQFDQTKTFVITDRPVYRPGQTMKFKAWISQAKYDLGNVAPFAGKSFQVVFHNARGEEVHKASFKADEYGGINGEWAIPADALLGQFGLSVVNYGGSNFRVEEYKKPEFEVLVEAPTEPVMLGEKVHAKIQAKYYFGSPVTEAKVQYKVLRTSYTQRWYPICRWDWLYGKGYGWCGVDYAWYPGWERWGHRRPPQWWWGPSYEQPEVVAEQEVAIGPDGTVDVEIDTALAAAFHNNYDHRYEITAEVVDQSRRTIVGSGEVLVARKPFQVVVWIDRGYVQPGDTVTAHIAAHTLNKKPVTGKGELSLYKIDFDAAGEPKEQVVEKWAIDTDVEGEVRQQFKAGAAGQYRLSYKLTDAGGKSIEGGYIFQIIGQQVAGQDYRFNDIELQADKTEYAPGEGLKLLVNTNRANSTVLLFLRPWNGVYERPQVLKLDGKSRLEDVKIQTGDMPNFFVEAVTISNGRVHQETREIFVPPQQRVLDVVATPSATTYLPGADGKVAIKLTDLTGEPFVGSTVVVLYDKSVEYISGGSNVPDMKEFFWKWRRQHHPVKDDNSERHFDEYLKNGERTLQPIGVFGNVVWEEEDRAEGQVLRKGMAMQRGLGGGFGGGGAVTGFAMPAAAPMAAEAQAVDGLASNSMALADAAKDEKAGAKGDGGGGGPQMVQPTVRTNFADTALWVGELTTDKEGKAEVPFKLPESLSTWKLKVWAMGLGTRVGEAQTEVVTRKNLLVRLQAPRFFTQTDEVVLSANVHNYLKQKKAVQVKLEMEGDVLTLMGGEGSKTIEIDANGEARVDWRVKVKNEGTATIRMLALTDEESDAMQMTFPAYIHGMLKMESWAGALDRTEKNGKVVVRVPAERRPEQSRLEVRYSPTIAGAMVDALPYLVDYPYGCTEQTLNRFLPTVVVQKTLLDMKLDLAKIQEKRTNLNAQELGDDQARAKQWKRYDRNPVFDAKEVELMTKDGVKALTEMQLSDGGWGWFSGYGEHSWPHTTVVVVHGLQVAKECDVALVPGVLERGVDWLKQYQDKQVTLLKNAATQTKPWKNQADELDAFVFMVLTDANVKNDAMKDFLYRDRTKLAVYAKALYGLALHKLKEADKLAMILENIDQFVVQDEENQTAHLRMPAENPWWWWYGSETEAHAFCLKLWSQTDPKGKQAARLAKYLVNNRKHASYWNSTRDTAYCIEALRDFLKGSGEGQDTITVQVWVDGKQQQSVEITPDNLFSFDNTFVLTGDALTSGEHTVELKKDGDGPLYYNVYLTNFTLEDPITKAGLEVKVSRKYYKLVRVDADADVVGQRGQVVNQKVEKYERQELDNLATLTSGDLVEVELEIDSKNDYEYLLFEDMKAAGFETVDVRSGYVGKSLQAYMEVRDNRVCFFVRQLLRGKHSVAYRLRAEIPGKFSALPTVATGMYAPELKGNSDEIKLQIVD